MKRLIPLLLFLLVLIPFVKSAVAGTAKVGISDKEITPALLKKFAVGMPMQEVEALLGAPGRYVSKKDGVERYRWKGRSTALTVSFEKKRLVDAIGVSPKGKYFCIEEPEVVFTEAWLDKLGAPLTYQGLVALVGQPAMTAREDDGTTRTEIHRWNGGEGSSLSVKVAGGNVVDARITSPKGETHSLRAGGEVTATAK